MPALLIKNTRSAFINAKKQQIETNSGWKNSFSEHKQTNAVFNNGKPESINRLLVFNQRTSIDKQSTMVYSVVIAKNLSLELPWSFRIVVDENSQSAWENLNEITKKLSSSYRFLDSNDIGYSLVYSHAKKQDRTVTTVYSHRITVENRFCAVWEKGGNGQDFSWYPIDTLPGTLPPLPGSGAPINQILSVYFIMHTIAVVKLPERTPVEAKSIQMSRDIDSFSWRLSMVIASKSDLDIIVPDINGVKEIEINIDGYVWEFIVEEYTDNRTFGSSGYTITGRSKTAYLAAPYKLPINFTEATQKTAIQLIDNELVNSGFTAIYNTVDWLVDANAFTYQNKSPIQAIMQVAGAVGAVIKPHNALNQIEINPRYPINPWDWPAATPTATITHDIIRSQSGQWRPKADINAVYVSGATIGVNCFVKRTGTAGDKLATQIVDNLVTHQDAGREYGRNIISDRGKQQIVSIEMPVMPLGQNPGIYSPGDLIEIDEGSGNIWKGKSIGISVNAQVSDKGVISAGQTLTLERHYGNT